MVDFGTTKAGQDDAFRNVQSEIDNVRDIMSQNIEQVLERGERIDLLVDKTDRLGGSARDFRVRSRGLRRRMWWKNVRLMVMLVLVVVFLVYLLVGFGCGECFFLLPSPFLVVSLGVMENARGYPTLPRYLTLSSHQDIVEALGNGTLFCRPLCFRLLKSMCTVRDKNGRASRRFLPTCAGRRARSCHSLWWRVCADVLINRSSCLVEVYSLKARWRWRRPE